MARNFSISLKAQDEKAIVEFPLESVRDGDSIDDTEYPGPKTSQQVIVHKEYQDNANNKTLRSTHTYRLTKQGTVNDPFEVEYDKEKGPPRKLTIQTNTMRDRAGGQESPAKTPARTGPSMNPQLLLQNK